MIKMMKRITIVLDEEALTSLDLQPLLRAASDVRMETVESEARGKSPHVRHKFPEKSIETVIMSHYTPEGMFSVPGTVGKWLETEGFNPASASPGVSVLVKKGYLERLGKGRVKFARPMRD